VAFGRSEGGVLVDPSLPLDNVEAQLNSTVLAYGRTFGLFDRLASFGLAVPYVWGDISGDVFEEQREVTRSGFADARLRFAVNLIGGPALTPAEFVRRKPQTTLGASMVVAPPVGEYDSSKLVNLGSNRWSFKADIGLAHPWGRWDFEASTGVWVFTDNDDFFGGQHREQEPITTFQLHVGYTIRPRLWIAVSGTNYQGGRTTIDGTRNADLQENTRYGLTVSLPVGARQSAKLAWSEGASTRIGSDFSTVGLAWQYVWF
jgi:hypothetical protein